jgi:hypothetical protein
MKKIILIIIIIITFCLATMYGFFSPFNYFTAKQEIKMNKFKKVCINKHPVRLDIEKSVGYKYGIDVVHVKTKRGIIPPIYYLGIKTYNNQMINAYLKIKGERLYKKYLTELDSINNRIIVK